MYDFESDLVWRMLLMLIKGKKIYLCMEGSFNLICLVIEFVIPKLRFIFVYQKSLNQTFRPGF